MILIRTEIPTEALCLKDGATSLLLSLWAKLWLRWRWRFFKESGVQEMKSLAREILCVNGSWRGGDGRAPRACLGHIALGVRQA